MSLNLYSTNLFSQLHLDGKSLVFIFNQDHDPSLTLTFSFESPKLNHKNIKPYFNRSRWELMMMWIPHDNYILTLQDLLEDTTFLKSIPSSGLSVHQSVMSFDPRIINLRLNHQLLSVFRPAE